MNKVKTFVLIVISIILMFRLIMICTTYDLILYVEKIMLNEIPQEKTEGTIYNLFQSKTRYTIDKAEVNIRRGWIFHDFQSGEINVIYHVRQYSNGVVVYSSYAPSKWLIEKKDGKWEIVKIIEKP